MSARSCCSLARFFALIPGQEEDGKLCSTHLSFIKAAAPSASLVSLPARRLKYSSGGSLCSRCISPCRFSPLLLQQGAGGGWALRLVKAHGRSLEQKKKKREKKHQQNNKKPPNPGVCSHLSPKPKQNLAAKPAAGVAEQEAPKPALNLRGRNPAYNFSQRKREGERKKKRI